MGADMDIDMNIGLVKPKNALTPKVTLTEVLLPASPDAESPDFSLLLEGTQPDSKKFSEILPAQVLEVAVPFQLPQAEAPDITVALDTADTQEIDPVLPAVPDLKIAPDKEGIPKTLAHPVAELPLISAKMQGDIPILTHPILAAAATPATAHTPTMPEKAANITPLSTPLLANTPASPALPQARDITSVLAKPIAPASQPTLSTPIAPLLPVALDKAGKTAPIQTTEEPEVTQNTQPAPPVAKATAQPQAQPLPPIGFTNIETATDDPAEIQFSIKIDRQVAVDAPISRSATSTPPVATQISAQLPALITKAEKQTIELRLDPPELGRVTIHLTTNDQQVTAQIIADRPDTVDLMRRHAELLTATLARAGFSQADLSFQQGQSQGGKEGFSQFQTAANLTEADEPALASPPSASLDGRLDIRL